MEDGDCAATHDSLPDRLYVNGIRCAVALSDIRIDLGQRSPGSRELADPVRLVSSPDFLLEMQGELRKAIARYEEQFGSIAGLGHG